MDLQMFLYLLFAVGVGWVVGAARSTSRARRAFANFQGHMMATMVDGTTKLANAAVDVMVDEYKADAETAIKQILDRCNTKYGMKMAAMSDEEFKNFRRHGNVDTAK